MPWALPADEPSLLSLAKSYPFEAPEGCFHFAEGGVRPIANARFEGRVPVLAHGSNRSPDQLRRKYGEAAEIPVTAGWLDHYDVVYSAHITQYGSIASALRPAPGCRVRIFVNWLDERQLARMHETEGPSNYSYGTLTRLSLSLDSGPTRRLGAARVYMSNHGHLSDGGRPVSLAAVPGERRPGRALHQEQVLDFVRERHRPDLALDAMILGAIRDQALRRALIDDLRAEAVAQETPDFAPI